MSVANELKEQFQAECGELGEAIAPLLAGHTPVAQGAILADLMALWLVSHAPRDRDRLLDLQVSFIRKMIPVHEAMLSRMRTEE